MTLNQLDAHSRRHMSISAQGKGKGKDSGQILQNDQQNSKSTLAADGVLSLNSSALQVLDNTTLRGGAINIKAGGGIIKRSHIDWETQDTATMRSAELKPLSGMMSIESGGDNPLTVEPGNRIVSAGDLAVNHNGTFQISARAGNNGNPSAQTASVSAKGNIGIVAGEVDIDAANIAAGKDLALVATKGNISLNSIRNTFSNYQLKTDKHNITQQLTDVEQELSKLTSDPKYRKAQDLPQMLRRKYKRRDKVFGDSEARLRGLRAKINAADEAWAELQSPVKALLERKQLLQQALLTVSQPCSGHENQGSTLAVKISNCSLQVVSVSRAPKLLPPNRQISKLQDFYLHQPQRNCKKVDFNQPLTSAVYLILLNMVSKAAINTAMPFSAGHLKFQEKQVLPSLHQMPMRTAASV